MTVIVSSALALGLLALIFLGLLPGAFGLVAALIVIAAVYWRLRDRIQNILLVFVSVFLAMIIVQSPAPRISDAQEVANLRTTWAASGEFDERLPVVLHLVFDEMMSPGAIDETIPTGATARQELYALGERYGLRTFDSVYSRSFFSGVSMPNLFNAEYHGDTSRAHRFTRPVERLPQNGYFEDMARRGYRTVVFQTSLLDFCASSSVRMCETFPSFDPNAADGGSLDLRSRIVHVSDVLLDSYEPSYVSRLGRRVLSYLGEAPSEAAELGADDRFDVHGFTSWFDRFIGFVEGVPRGTHVFAHLMVPHGPYMLSEDCRITGNGGVGYYLGNRFPDETARAAARREYFAAYFAQLRCVRDRIAAFLEAVRRTPTLHDARIIIHGDHGSRISVGNLIEDYETDDYIANYGAYFAVRAPGVPPGRDCEFLSLIEAFRRFVEGPVPLRPLDRGHPPVLVQSKTNSELFVEGDMPRFGCAVDEAVEEDR